MQGQPTYLRKHQMNGNGFANFDSQGHDGRPYHQGHHHYQSPPINGFDYYQDADVEESVNPEFNYSANKYLGPHPGPSSLYHDSITRASSADSLDFQFPTFDPRAPAQVSNGQPNPYMNQQSKCRQLPCRTFISTGSCPYGDRCVFLHDPSIVSKPIYIRSKRKSRDDSGIDAFFWPTMPWNAVMGRVDMKNMPLITQPYIVPAPNSYSMSTSNNDVAVYSMWEHFLDFCKEDPLSIVTMPRKVPLLNAYSLTNHYTGKRRLPVFVSLSQHDHNHFI